MWKSVMKSMAQRAQKINLSAFLERVTRFAPVATTVAVLALAIATSVYAQTSIS